MIYGGIYEEGSPLSDADGFRKDVMEAVKRSAFPSCAGPAATSPPATTGGRHRPEGPTSRAARRRLGRPRNQPLRHRRVSALLRAHRRRAVHLHQRRPGHIDEARIGWSIATNAATLTGPTSAARTAEKPYNVKLWGLGNEIDGPWQLGHKNAEDYAKFALEAAKAMRRGGCSIKLIASGSRTSAPIRLDRLEPHRPRPPQETRSTTSRCTPTSATARTTREVSRRIAQTSTGASPPWTARSKARAKQPDPRRPIYIAFDEWNVWYRDRVHGIRDRPGPAWRSITISRTRWPWACFSTPSSATPIS
jgi:alpha-N-arabinofuranosidase